MNAVTRARAVWIGVGLGVCLLIGFGVWLMLRPRPATVHTFTVRRQVIENQIFGTGQVQPRARQVIMPSTVNVPVQRFTVAEGDTVRVGQPLMRLQAPTSSSYIGTAPRARIAGIVLVENPDGVDSSGNPVPLVQIVSRQKQALIGLSEVDAVHVRRGLGATITCDAYPGQSWRARVTQVAAYAASTNAGANQVNVALEPLGAFPVPYGYDVTANLRVSNHRLVTVVPYSALVQAGNDYRVYVVQSGRVHAVTVALGATANAVVQVVRGVRVGDVVVVNPPIDLRDGEAVVTA